MAPPRMVHIELDRIVKPFTIYLALHQRRDRPSGGFNWAIVVTLASGSDCIVYKAYNPHPTHPDLRDWVVEEDAPLQWTPYASATLLCMFEVRVCIRRDVTDHVLAMIRAAGRVVMEQRSVSPYRRQNVFTNKSFALDVLAQVIPSVSGDVSRNLENRARTAAIACREQATAAGEYMTSGWFKIFRLETVVPVE